MAKLYIFLVSTDWLSMYPLSFINLLARDISDHALLVLDLGLLNLNYADFLDLVCMVGSLVCKI